MPRKWEPREQRMTVDYLIKFHPDAKHMTRVRLGPLPPAAARAEAEGMSPRLYVPVLHWADALALYPDRTVIIETKIKLTADALGQILTNAALFLRTDEFWARWTMPLIKEVVYAYPDEEVLRMLRLHGVKFVFFRPDYIKEYYLERIRTTYGKG